MWTSVRVLELGLSLHSSASKLCTLGQFFHSLVGAWWPLVASKFISSCEGDESVVGPELQAHPDT